MANHASAVKRNRQRIKRTDRNRAVKSALRTALKKARAAVDGGAENAAALVVEAQSQLDVAAKKGVIPTGRADRVKGRLAAAKQRAAAAK
jgi:small subunit ribosomal protein S20